MFVGNESRVRDRFGHRRELNENPRDFYYNSQNLMRQSRNFKEMDKQWLRKHEERDYPHSIEHQKYRSSRTLTGDYGYSRYDHPHPKYPPEPRHRSRSRSPIPLWPSHHRREYSEDRRFERRREVENMNVYKHEPRRSAEHRSTFPNTKRSESHKMKSHPPFKPGSGMIQKRGSDRSNGSKNKFVRNQPHMNRKKRSLTPSKRRRSLSRVSSTDFKSSPSTGHLEKQKKYLVDRLAEYENKKPISPGSLAKPKSPARESIKKDDAEAEDNDSRGSHSPSSSSLQSFDDREETDHFNINFPDDSEDDNPADEELLKAFDSLENPEFVKFPKVDFRPLFVREEFRRKREDGLKEGEKNLIKEFRKNGLKKDSVENKKYIITQNVVENIPDISQIQETSKSEIAETQKFSTPSVNLPRKFLSQQPKQVTDGFDLRQRIHERLQNKQTNQVCNQSDDDIKSYIPNKDYYRRTEQNYEQGDAMVSKTMIRRVVSSSKPLGLMRTFSNGSTQRSVVLTRPRPANTDRFIE